MPDDLNPNADTATDSHAAESDAAAMSDRDSTIEPQQRLGIDQIRQLHIEEQLIELREAVMLLDASRESYATLYDSAPVGFLSLDRKGLILKVNLFGGQMLGREPQQLIGSPFALHLVKNQSKYFFQFLKKVFKETTPQSVDVLLQGDAENGRHARLISLSITAEIAEPVEQCLMVMLDVTETVLAAEALRKSEFTLRTFVDNVPAVVFLKDPDGRIQLINKAFEDLLGVSRNQAFGRTAKELFPDPVASDIESSDLEVVRTMVPVALEPMIKDKKNEVHTFDALKFPLIDEQGSLFGIGGVATDITERKRLDSALRESEERFRATFEQAAVGIAHIDREGRYLRVNDKLCAILGFSRAEFLRMNCKDITCQEDLEQTQVYIRRIVSGKADTANLEKRYVRKDGVLIWTSLTVSSLRDRQGRFKYFISVLDDISDRKQLEERVQENQSTLFRVGRISTMGVMAGAIAHEMNQPLMAIANYAGGAVKRLESSPTIIPGLKEAMEQIIELAERSGGIIKRIRSFTQTYSENYGSVNLNQVVSESIELVKVQMRKENVMIKTSFDNRLPPVYGDFTQLEQVVVNLLLNGMEAMEQTMLEEKRLLLTTQKTSANSVELIARDWGSGLAPSVVEKLFEPFVTTKKQGMGLGLSISQAIVEAHGGRMQAVSEPEGGTSLHIVLPICKVIDSNDA